MSKIITFDAEVKDDGTLTIQLPPDAPRGQVRITVEQTSPALSPEEQAAYEIAYDPELEALLTDESLRGLGLTAEEIAKSPEIGIWADRTDMIDSVEFIAEMRRKNRERRLNRND